MNRLANQLISYLLLLSISATVIPSDLLHHHHEETHCDLSNVALENDPCHIGSYHAHEAQKVACKHEAHFNEQDDHCDLCKLLSSHTHSYVGNKQLATVHDLVSQALPSFSSSFFPSALASAIFSRGPPV